MRPHSEWRIELRESGPRTISFHPSTGCIGAPVLLSKRPEEYTRARVCGHLTQNFSRQSAFSAGGSKEPLHSAPLQVGLGVHTRAVAVVQFCEDAARVAGRAVWRTVDSLPHFLGPR